MNYKSYLIEQNLNIINENVILFYGENIGLKNEFRQKIKTNKNFNGPAIIEESTATTIIPPNYNIVKDDFGNIIITKEE